MSDSEFRQMVIDGFHKMKTQDDLLALLNKMYRSALCSDVDESVFKPITMKSLNYYKNVKASGARRYRTFQIRKKSGKMRTISAPCRGLKVIQYCLNIIFQAFYEPNANACGFVPGKSIADGARVHTGKRYVYNIDLKDFFDTIELYRVKAILTLPPFNLKDDKNNSQSLPYVIANLCCHPKMVTHYVSITNELLYGNLDEVLAVVSFVNKDKGIANVVYGREKTGFFKYAKLLKRVRIGDVLDLRISNGVANGGRLDVAVAAPHKGKISGCDFYKIINGNVRSNVGCTFYSIDFKGGRAHIPMSMVTEHKLTNGDCVTAAVLYEYNKKRGKWDWRCISIKTVSKE